MTMGNTKSGAAILTASDMKPGAAPAKGTVDIKNTGSLSGAFTLSKGTIVDSDGGFPMSGKLDVVVTDCGTDVDCVLGRAPSSTPAPSPGWARIALGNFAANERAPYEFSVQFDATADNNYQGGNSTVPFTWNAS